MKLLIICKLFGHKYKPITLPKNIQNLKDKFKEPTVGGSHVSAIGEVVAQRCRFCDRAKLGVKLKAIKKSRHDLRSWKAVIAKMRKKKMKYWVKDLIARWKWYRMTPEQRKEFQAEAIRKVLERNKKIIADHYNSELFSRRPWK